VLVLAVTAILAAAAVPVALHYADALAIAPSASAGSEEPPSAPSEPLDAELAKLVDVERFTDAERKAGTQLAFASREADPCGAFDEGLAFVERSRSEALLELLPRVGVPDGCDGLGQRVDAVLGKPKAPPPAPERSSSPEPKAAPADEGSAVPAQERRTRATPKRSAAPRAPAKPKKAPRREKAEAPAARPLPAAPRLDDGLRKPTGL
jgi:hypothetical protein